MRGVISYTDYNETFKTFQLNWKQSLKKYMFKNKLLNKIELKVCKWILNFFSKIKGSLIF